MKVSAAKINNSFLSYRPIWLTCLICISIIAGTSVNVFSYIAFLFMLIAIVALRDEEILCVFMFVMSFANIFKANPTSQSFFTYSTVFYVLWCLIKKKAISVKFLTNIILLVTFLVLQMLLSFNVLRTIKFTVNILFIYFAIHSEALKNTKELFLFYILGVLVSSSIRALDLFPNIGNYIITQDFGYEGERVIRFAGMYGDPNYYSINLIISLCLLVVLNHKKELSALSSIFLASIAVSFVIMTVSKSPFIMLAFPLILLFYSTIKKKNYFIFLILCILATVFIFALFLGEIELFDVILYRFDKATDINSLTTGRSYIWMNYIEYLIQHPFHALLGGGVGSAILNGRVAHNTYIDMLYHLGLAGTILTVSTFLSMRKRMMKNFQSNLLNYSIWICIAIMYFFLSELFHFDWLFHFIIAISVSMSNMNQVQEETLCAERQSLLN